MFVLQTRSTNTNVDFSLRDSLVQTGYLPKLVFQRNPTPTVRAWVCFQRTNDVHEREGHCGRGKTEPERKGITFVYCERMYRPTDTDAVQDLCVCVFVCGCM